jgi:hypothetical protein
LKSSALQESYGIQGNRVGKVVWHSLKKNGTITQYDIRFGNRILKGVPVRLIESIKEQDHKHKER